MLLFVFKLGEEVPPVEGIPTPQGAFENYVYSYTVPAFCASTGETLTYAMTLGTGEALPSWLTFTASTRTVTGTPQNTNLGTIVIAIVVSDLVGTSVTVTYTLIVNRKPVLDNAIPD